MYFGSDNQAGARPEVLAAVSEAVRLAGDRPLLAYGADPITARVTARFVEIFERPVRVFLVATGTAANALALSAFARPGGIVYCHRQAHIHSDECGAPEFLAGCRLRGLGGPAAKLDPAELAAVLADRQAEEVRAGVASREHHGQPMAVSISQTTELGAVYAPGEIAAIAEIARRRRVPLHMDGARFANAVAATGAAPADLTWRAGVDVLSFGGTKNGCLAAEAVIFFDPERGAEFPFLRKRAGHLLSKSWLVAAQLEAALAGDRWLDWARHANAMAARLAQGITAAGRRLALPCEANEVFPVLLRGDAERLRRAGAVFYEWPAAELGADEVMVRLVTSFQTRPEDVDRFVAILRGGAAG